MVMELPPLEDVWAEAERVARGSWRKARKEAMPMSAMRAAIALRRERESLVGVVAGSMAGVYPLLRFKRI